jgi:DNA-binding winged helix-turn-helix (wHTH) protein/tetratricopeptide (TPR) repeat protein
MATGGCRIDEINQCLWHGGERFHLTPKVFAVLHHLSQHPGQLVLRQTLLDAIWPDTHVTEAVLTVAIAQLREALGDDAQRPSFIETVHRRGYRWIGQTGARGEVVGGGEAAAPLAPEPEADSSRVFGREREIDVLRRALALARAGKRQLVFVTGEPGIGKTSLIDAFVAEIAAQEADSHLRGPDAGSDVPLLLGRGQCIEQYGHAEAYTPVLEAVEALCRDEEVERVLRSHAPTWLVQLPGVVSGQERTDLLRTLDGSSAARMIRELSSALATLARERLVVMVFEDLHWSDRATVALLATLAQRREPVRLLLLATYRSVDAIVTQHSIVALERELAAKRQCIQVALEGLESAAIGAYLRWRFPGGEFSDDLCQVLQTQTTGNPLFLETAVEDFAHNGWLHEVDGGWTCAVSSETIRDALPPAVRDLIEQRFERLPPRAREVLETASVAGLVFSSQAVAAALEAEDAEIEESCMQLARAERFVQPMPSSVWPDGSCGASFGFRHAVYRQVFEARVAPARRARAHLRIAARMEAGYGGRAGEIAPQLATHYERGGDGSRAAAHCHAAARAALGRYASEQAVDWLHRGLALLENLPETAGRTALELRLRAALIGPLTETQGTGSAELRAAGDRIRELSRGDVTAVEVMQALGGLVVYHLGRGSRDDALDAAQEQLRRVQADSGLQILEPAVRYQIGIIDLVSGSFEAAVANLAPALQLPSLLPLTPCELNLAAELDIALARLVLGFPDSALKAAADASARAIALGHPFTIVYVSLRLQHLAGLALEEGLIAEAARNIHEVADRTGHAHLQGLATIADARVMLGRGDGATAARMVREGMNTAFDNATLLPQRMITLAEGLLVETRLDEARQVIENLRVQVERTDIRWCDAEIERLGAEIEAADDRFDAAERSFRAAVDVARNQRARWLELKAAIGLARLERHRGRSTEGRNLLAALYGGFTEGFDLPDLRAARALLDDFDKP